MSDNMIGKPASLQVSASLSQELWFCRLPNFGVLAVSGADAGKLLQGQCTCDILALQEEQCVLGAFCNAKGRVITVFRVLRFNGIFYLLLPQDFAADMESRLRRVIFRSQVLLENVSDRWRAFGVGGEPDRLASHLGLDAPVVKGSVRAAMQGFAIGVEGGRLLIVIPTGQAEAFSAHAAEQGLSEEDPQLWLLEDIRSGIPHIMPATGEEFVPQMINLDLLDAISFKKGCYIGQEIVARTHYLGKLKRRMFRLRVESVRKPEAGDPLFEEAGSGQSAGMVVQSATVGENGYEMLAVLSMGAEEKGGLRCFDPTGPQVSVLPLP